MGKGGGGRVVDAFEAPASRALEQKFVFLFSGGWLKESSNETS